MTKVEKKFVESAEKFLFLLVETFAGSENRMGPVLFKCFVFFVDYSDLHRGNLSHP